jgi:hypothetical protein
MVGDIGIVECKEKTSMEFLVLYSEVWQAWPQLDGKKWLSPNLDVSQTFTAFCY